MRAARIAGATLLAAALMPAAASAQQPGLDTQSYGQSGDAKSAQRKKRVDEPRRPRDQSEQSRRQQEEIDRWREMMR
jgi:type II secretory pathway component HofQ